MHGCMAAYGLGIWHPKIHPELVPYVESGIKWYDANVKKVIAVEQRYVDERNQYTGQIDLLAETVNDGVAVIDWKTSVAAYDIWELTTAAYKNLVEINLNIDVDTRMTVRLRKEPGKPALQNYWEGDGLKTFLSAARVINKLGMPRGGINGF